MRLHIVVHHTIIYAVQNDKTILVGPLKPMSPDDNDDNDDN